MTFRSGTAGFTDLMRVVLHIHHHVATYCKLSIEVEDTESIEEVILVLVCTMY